MNYTFDSENSIIMYDYLDVLLNLDNRESGCAAWNQLTKNQKYYQLRYKKEIPENESASKADAQNECKYTGGLILPKKEHSRGSGNVVIIGEPGVGKSTLAFQMAYSIVSDINNGIAVYYSLGVPRSTLIMNMLKESAPDKTIAFKFTKIADNDNINDNDEDLCRHFVSQLKENSNGPIRPQILLPMLSPRGVSEGGNDSVSVYRQRYTEIEYMLRAIRKYNSEESNTVKVKAVIIDSLNEFSNEPLKKQEITRLFELFEYYGMLGIFTVGENKNHSQEELINVEAIKYDADTVIQLRRTQYKNYTGHLFSVTKSRYIRAVLGEHPYKIKTSPSFFCNIHTPYVGLKKYIEVLPSLHHVISGCSRNLESMATNPHTEGKLGNIFGIPALDYVLPDQFSHKHEDISQIIAIKGSSGGFKSDIAVNALMNGVRLNKAGLIIRLNDMDSFDRCGVRLEYSLTKNKFVFKHITTEEIQKQAFQEGKPFMYKSTKRNFYCWEPSKLPGHEYANLYEIVFNSGALLPEEFMEDIIFIIKAYDIKTVVFTDIKYIGVSYPFLIENQTSGDLFLSAFIHIMRNMGVNLIMTSSNTEYTASSNELHKISILSDAVLECSKDPQSNDVHIWGEGAIITGTECIIKPNYKGESEKLTRDDYAVKFDGEMIDLAPFQIQEYVPKKTEQM